MWCPAPETGDKHSEGPDANRKAGVGAAFVIDWAKHQREIDVGTLH